MPAYNFQKQFADAVRSGKKGQTVRPKRKRQTKSGDRLVLYTGMRTKSCEKLLETTCKEVLPLEIHVNRLILDGKNLSFNDAVSFAQADGFTSLGMFIKFFIEKYKLRDGKPLSNMEVIRWVIPQECDNN